MLVSASVKHVLGSAYTVAVPLAILATKSDIWRVTRAVNTYIIMIQTTLPTPFVRSTGEGEPFRARNSR